MKILLRYCGLNARAYWQGLVEAQLRKLEGLAAIGTVNLSRCVGQHWGMAQGLFS